MNLGVIEIGAAGQDSADEDRRIDGRDFGLEHALAILKIEKVAEETMCLGHARFDKAEGVSHAIADLLFVFPAAKVGNAQAGEAKSGCGDAGDVARVRSAGLAAILDQTRVGIGLVPEK